MYSPPCAFYDAPTEAQARTFKITDPDIVLGCKNRVDSDGSFFFIPVEGGAVRAGVCRRHAAWLRDHHDLIPDGHPRPGP